MSGVGKFTDGYSIPDEYSIYLPTHRVFTLGTSLFEHSLRAIVIISTYWIRSYDCIVCVNTRGRVFPTFVQRSFSHSLWSGATDVFGCFFPFGCVDNFWLHRESLVVSLNVEIPPPFPSLLYAVAEEEKCVRIRGGGDDDDDDDDEMINDYHPFTFLVEPFSLPVHLLYIFLHVRVVNW